MNTSTPNKDKYLKAAHNIGKKLAKEAIWHENRCNWIGHSLEVVDNQYQVTVKACSQEYYNGLTGIAVFLAELYEYTKDRIILHTLEGAVNNIIKQSEDKLNLGDFGVFSGKLGIGYTLYSVGKKINKEEWISKGLDLIRNLEHSEIKDYEIDVISGVAGAIPVLLKIYQEENNKLFLDLAIRCGEFLIKKAIKTPSSWSWLTVDPKHGLTGYSHGAAGISLALLELFITTKQDKYKEAAFFGFSYEKELFNHQEANWPDLREQDGKSQPICGEMWCHGAPGIALSRLRAHQISGLEFFRKEAEIALSTTYKSVQNSFNQANTHANFSLCHGVAGNADILLSGGTFLSNQSLLAIAYQVGDMGIEKYDHTGLNWPSGINDPSGRTPGQQETPGLMLGEAGTGYFYLRLHNPSKVDSILIG